MSKDDVSGGTPDRVAKLPEQCMGQHSQGRKGLGLIPTVVSPIF